MPFIQDLIHLLEVGGGRRYFRVGLVVLALVMLTVGYDWRAYRNLSTPEAMDTAQLARNLAQGKGYTTLFIRPFSMYLVKRRNEAKLGPVAPGKAADLAEIRGMHPDVSNPPVYPLVLAGLMKVLPFRYPVDTTHPFWSVARSRLSEAGGRQFWRYQPDFLIALFNQVLFFGVVVVVFLLGRRLFDAPVAWLSAALLLGTELFWRFSVSGLSTLLLVLIFLALVWSLVLLEQEIREPKRGRRAVLGLAALTGAVIGLGGLTRYAFGWLIVPVVLFLILFSGPRRWMLALVVFLVFAGVMAPWVVRNYRVSGTAFGTAGYAVMESSILFSENRLQRSLEPDLSRTPPMAFWYKLMASGRQIVQNDLPKLGGSWITAFFLVSLLVGFRNLALSRLRYFLLICLGVLALTQALGRTQLSDESPEINSENLLVLVAPLALVYGVSLFYVLLDQMVLPFRELRYVVIGLFGLVACLPMILAFLPPRGSPVAYPPYYPPAIQTVAGWMKEKELTMSDIPWAVAWYGQRQCVWLTLRATPDPKETNPSHEDFFAINDYQKPIQAIYLTPETMDARFLSQWIRAGELSWGSFIFETLAHKKVPEGFPLNVSQFGWLPEQIVLTDWERWRKTPLAGQ